MSRLERLGLPAVSVRSQIELVPGEGFNGTVDVYRNYIDIFRKDKKPAPLGNRILSSLSKKGRFVMSYLKSDFVSFEESENSFILKLNDGTRLVITPEGNDEKEKKALLTFCN